MFAWLNFGALLLSGALVFYLYVKSVRPAALAREIGPAAWPISARYRLLAGLLMGVCALNYVLYVVYPLPLPLPESFPWPWEVSVLIAVLIGLPSGWLFWRGMRDAGVETMAPSPEHTLYRGIYRYMRHPQAVGEVMQWWVIAFVLHSPFLVIFSFVWLPVFYWMVMAEEKDLLLRYGDDYAAYRARTGAFFPRRAGGNG